MTFSRSIACLFLFSFSFASLQAQSFEEYRKKKQQQFSTYKQQQQRRFEEYRRQRNIEFAKYIGQDWNMFKGINPLPLPDDKEIAPIIYNKEKERQQDKEIETVVFPFEEQNIPQPQPLEPIEENDIQLKTGTFVFYGTKMNVRWGDIASVKLKNVTEREVSRIFLKMTDKEYTNLLSDCLSLREKHSLCDWAYYMMLKNMSETACGKGTNEATLLRAVLMCQSGYKVRFAADKSSNKLYLLVGLNTIPYKYTTFEIDNEIFSELDGNEISALNIMTHEYKGEKPMSLSINKLPVLDKRLSQERVLTSDNCLLKSISVVNRNIVDFFNDYPTSSKNDDFMVRWAYYANTPVSDEVRRMLYPELKEKIAGQSELMAVKMLLEWTQFSFPYKSDEEMWGYDRAFFAEETLFYPGSDCEDHAIIFSHLVRDLVGLDVALIYFPGHLLTAVGFIEDVRGDCTTIKGRKFVMADPTWMGYPVGRVGSEYSQQTPKTILLKR